MKAVMFSIRPFWCGKIAQYEKSAEVRKRFSEIETPFKAYIYCTKDKKMQFWRSKTYAYADDRSHNSFDICGNGKVIGEFVCNELESFTTDYRMNREQTERISKQSCIPMTDLMEYEGNAPCLWAIHISDLVIYDIPKPLGMFYKECPGLDNTGMCWECENAVGEEYDCGNNGLLYLTRAPQSYMFVEELK